MLGNKGMHQKKACVYFLSGTCRYGESCRFSHAIGVPADAVGSMSSTRLARVDDHSSTDTLADSRVVTSFKLEELQQQLAEKLVSSSLSSSHSDALVCFSPGQDDLEGLWKGFLTRADPWPINSQTQALNFINSGLYALTTENSASAFVKELGKTDGRGIAVLRELLELKYSTNAGRQRDVVSFQRGMVSFVAMLTMRRIELISLHMDEANYVYSFLRSTYPKLCTVFQANLKKIVERHSFEDPALPHASFLENTGGRRYAPLCFTQVGLPFIRLLYLLGSKFKEVIYEAQFKEALIGVDALTSKWIAEAKGNENPLDSALCFRIMREEVARLNKMVRRGDRNIQLGSELKAKPQQKSASNSAMDEFWDMVEVGIPGKVELADGRVGPRYDNDRRDISGIQLLPTSDECFSRLPTLVPGNLPFHKNAHWLPPGPERWVDTHFRLYREDVCCSLRTCLQDLECRLTVSRDNFVGGRVRDANVDYNVYPIVQTFTALMHSVKPAEQLGLCITVRFPQPELTGKDDRNLAKADSVDTRRDIWSKPGRLPFNAMVALVVYAESKLQVVFCKIIVRDLDRLVGTTAEVTLQPYESRDFVALDRWQSTAFLHRNQDGSYPVMFLVEFNKVLYAAYEPILRVLQSIRPETLPLLEYLAPETPPAVGEASMEPPRYCLKSGFTFDLLPIIQSYPQGVGGEPQQLRLRPLREESRQSCERALSQYSTLEGDQAKALVRALSSRVACIQGLPGTGKSFIGSLLTRIVLKAKVSPVLIVCYTNHALDQFLCHLLDVGVTSLVRIGAQCKEKRLTKYNLTNVRQFTPRYGLKRLYATLDTHASAIANALTEVSADVNKPTWECIKGFLANNHPDEYDYFEERSFDLFGTRRGWRVAGCGDILEYWIRGRDGASHQRRGSRPPRSDVWAWNVPKRRAVLTEWVKVMRLNAVEELARAQKAYTDTVKKIEAVKEEADVDVLKRVQIIGMTTTGAAKYQQKIAAVAPPVVICEEAGEVLEAQLMACLTPACQHLVLIGDHKQLRPHITEYNLSVESAIGKRYALDVSLFERLVAPSSGLPFWMLTEQHRMRPQISELLRILFYPEVRDARETLEYPPLLGVDKNVFFVSHNYAEDGAHDSLTRYHSNEYEVAYLVATLKYLLLQGYNPGDIAILTPYVGQLMKLRAALQGHFALALNELDLEEIQRTFGSSDKGLNVLGSSKQDLSGAIRVATIDNFQGEEATVILASLVRSSTNVDGRGTIGFLKTPNRINVLLSRAKHGLILVGHGELLRAKSPLWQRVLDQLQSDGCYGNGLPLHCQRHPDYQRVATKPDSFALLAPDGGCLRPCGRRLPRCGHACPKLCHVDQPSHKAVYCTQPCPRLQEGCGHVCPGVCGDPCGRCEELVGSITLLCGHTYSNARCFEAKKPSDVRCNVVVEKLISVCGHKQSGACYITDVKCTRKCGAILPCGHPCSRNCSACIQKTLKAHTREPGPEFPIQPTEHGSCRKECERLLSCCHRCRGVCHGKAPCPPCQRICDVFTCEHASCNHPCSDPCAACTESCTWSCEHVGNCSLPCGAPCNRKLCDRRCSKSLSCGHQCPSVCGEDCPTRRFCHVCGDEDAKQRVADVILFQSYGEIDPSEDPVLVLPCCKMVYTMETLDGTLQMSSYYDMNRGEPLGPLPGDYIDMPQCPNCNKPIRGLRRYGRIIKRAAIDAAEKKFITQAQHQLTELQRRVNAASERGDLARDKTLHTDLRAFGSMVKVPPCQKVFEACVALLTKARGGDVDIDLSTLPVPNSTFRFLGYFNLFSAQLRLVGANASASNAQKFARQALRDFADGSYLQQTCEAKLVLVQTLLARADKALSESVKTEQQRTKREKVVEQFTSEASSLLGSLEVSGAVFCAQHEHDLQGFHRMTVGITQRAKSATFYQCIDGGAKSGEDGHASGISRIWPLVPMCQWALILDRGVRNGDGADELPGMWSSCGRIQSLVCGGDRARLAHGFAVAECSVVAAVKEA